MFKVSVHNEEEMKKFASGNNPIARIYFRKMISKVFQMWEMSRFNL